jgi:hypothetical protein
VWAGGRKISDRFYSCLKSHSQQKPPVLMSVAVAWGWLTGIHRIGDLVLCGNYSAEINIWEYCVCIIAMLVTHKCEIAILWDRSDTYVLSSQFHVIIAILWDTSDTNRNNAVQSIPSDPVRRSWLNPRSGVGSRRYLAYLYEVFYFLKDKPFPRLRLYMHNVHPINVCTVYMHANLFGR